MFDLLIRGGLVATPGSPRDLDIAIDSGKIAALGAPGTFAAASAERVIAADRLVVVPGGIDPHVHCNHEVPAPDGGKSTYTAPPSQVSLAALWGGTTTLIDFAWGQGDEPIARRLERYAEEWSDSYCDYSYHIVMHGRLSERELNEVPAIIDAGFPSFKIFTTNVQPPKPGSLMVRVPFGSIYDLLQVTAANHGIVAVHAEDDELVMHMYDKFLSAGKTHFRYLPEIHSAMSEDLSFHRVIRLAGHVKGAALYMVHVSADLGVRAIAEGRASGAPIYGETLHQYALHNAEDYLQEDGMKYHTYPSLKSRDDSEALWRGIETHDLSTFATDELCTSFAVKTSGSRIDNVVGGNSGVEPRMAIVYDQIVNKRKLGLDRFVEVTSTNAARILGLYPQKGVIAVGSDADLAVINPNDPKTITASDLHESDYTPWEGWTVGSWPVATVLRGNVVVEGGRFTGTKGSGRLVIRHLVEDVNAGPAV